MEEKAKEESSRKEERTISIKEINNLFERNRELEADLKKAKEDTTYWRNRYWGLRKGLWSVALVALAFEAVVVQIVGVWFRL